MNSYRLLDNISVLGFQVLHAEVSEVSSASVTQVIWMECLNPAVVSLCIFVVFLLFK